MSISRTAHMTLMSPATKSTSTSGSSGSLMATTRRVLSHARNGTATHAAVERVPGAGCGTRSWGSRA